MPELQASTESMDVIIQQACAGDADAFDALLDAHYDTMYRFAFRWCGNPVDAEDIVQDACIKLARHLRSFRGQAKFSSWLYRLVINCAHDWVRAHQRHQAAEPLELALDQAGVNPSHSNVMLSQVLNILAQFKEGYKETVLLVHGEGLTHAEAAKILDVKESTVSWRLLEVRRHLQRLNIQEPNDD